MNGAIERVMNSRDARPCEGGAQHCTYNYADTRDVLFWCACVAEPKCEPGEYLDRGFGRDVPASAACITDGDGEPDWDPSACMIGAARVRSLYGACH